MAFSLSGLSFPSDESREAKAQSLFIKISDSAYSEFMSAGSRRAILKTLAETKGAAAFPLRFAVMKSVEGRRELPPGGAAVHRHRGTSNGRSIDRCSAGLTVGERGGQRLKCRRICKHNWRQHVSESQRWPTGSVKRWCCRRRPARCCDSSATTLVTSPHDLRFGVGIATGDRTRRRRGRGARRRNRTEGHDPPRGHPPRHRTASMN